jgi:peptidoglycan hydrolase CwlO-like protein
MEELLDPIVDRIVNHKDLINQVKQDANKAAKRIEELKETIFNTNNKLDVFEQINLKIAKAEAEIKILEDKFDYENKNVKSRMDEMSKQFEI